MRYRENAEVDAQQWGGGEHPYVCRQRCSTDWPDAEDPPAHIHAVEGRLVITPGDFIVVNAVGEVYPIRRDVFERRYEPVSAPPLGDVSLAPHPVTGDLVCSIASESRDPKTVRRWATELLEAARRMEDGGGRRG